MVSFCASVSTFSAYLGGMRRAGSVAKMRCTMALLSGSPGTIGMAPEGVGFTASSRRSRRIPAMRARLSGPWQRKQVSDMMGRMSRLNLTGSAPATRAGMDSMATSRTVRSGCGMWNMLQRGASAGVNFVGATIENMSSVAGVSVEEYLSTAYRPDCDYVDGEVRERNVGEYPHSNLQTRLVIWFGNRQRDWNIRVLPEQRVRISAQQYRIPDVCVLRREQPIEPVFTRPPLICIEILSKDDRLRDVQERVDEYLDFGVSNVWILDPGLRKGYVCTHSGFQEPESGILQAAGSDVRIPPAEIFAQLEQ